jgi:hypothetical protein
LLSHRAAAKAYGRKHYLDYVPKEVAKLILNGNTVSYAQVFGNDEESGAFTFEFKETDRYLIDDQYCASPKCQCNEVVLVFYKIDPGNDAQESEFAVRLNLKTCNMRLKTVVVPTSE